MKRKSEEEEEEEEEEEASTPPPTKLRLSANELSRYVIRLGILRAMVRVREEDRGSRNDTEELLPVHIPFVSIIYLCMSYLKLFYE